MNSLFVNTEVEQFNLDVEDYMVGTYMYYSQAWKKEMG